MLQTSVNVVVVFDKGRQTTLHPQSPYLLEASTRRRHIGCRNAWWRCILITGRPVYLFAFTDTHVSACERLIHWHGASNSIDRTPYNDLAEQRVEERDISTGSPDRFVGPLVRTSTASGAGRVCNTTLLLVDVHGFVVLTRQVYVPLSSVRVVRPRLRCDVSVAMQNDRPGCAGLTSPGVGPRESPSFSSRDSGAIVVRPYSHLVLVYIFRLLNGQTLAHRHLGIESEAKTHGCISTWAAMTRLVEKVGLDSGSELNLNNLPVSLSVAGSALGGCSIQS